MKYLTISGFRFIKIKAKEKTPIEPNWQTFKNYPYNSLEIQQHIKNGGNVGVVCGFGGLIVIDFDDKEFQDKYLPLFPQTLLQRSGGGLMHAFFIADVPISKKILDKDKKTLCDIQGHGKQIIIEPSTHPNGNKYKFINNNEIAHITSAEIKRIFKDYFVEEKTFNKELTKPDLKTTLSSYGVDTSHNLTKCPWHSSKGGKCFSFDESKQLWHCFHCDKGGDVVTFVMEHEGIEFNEACLKLGIELKQKNKTLLSSYKLDNYMVNVSSFYKIQPFFYDISGLFWFWQKDTCSYEIVDEIDLMNGLDDSLNFEGETINTKIKSHYIEAFKRYGRKKKPKDAPVKWIQFKDKAYSIKTENIYDVEPNYFFTNPIPWEIGSSNETPTMDKLFKEWVGEEYVDTLYEIIAYCCYRDYPIQLLFSLCGSGRNGKSQFLKIVDKFIGTDNVTCTELDTLLTNRFESFKLYRKLVCNIGETNFGVLDKSSILKKITGGDKLGFEKKNKDPFDDYSYAKLIIASNSLPSSNDTSDGFYRRWLIINFSNEFEESGIDIINTIPEVEYNNLAYKVTKILQKLIQKGKFTNQGTIENRKRKYIEMSNPLTFWLAEHCKVSQELFCSYNEAYTNYMNYLNKNKKRKVKMKEFKSALEDEGIYIERTSKKTGEEWKNGLWVIGLDLKRADSCESCESCATISTQIPIRGNVSENAFITCTKFTKIDEIYYILQKKAQDINVNIQNMVEMGVSEQEIQENLRLGNYAECKKGFIQKI